MGTTNPHPQLNNFQNKLLVNRLQSSDESSRGASTGLGFNRLQPTLQQNKNRIYYLYSGSQVHLEPVHRGKTHEPYLSVCNFAGSQPPVMRPTEVQNNSRNLAGLQPSTEECAGSRAVERGGSTAVGQWSALVGPHRREEATTWAAPQLGTSPLWPLEGQPARYWSNS